MAFKYQNKVVKHYCVKCFQASEQRPIRIGLQAKRDLPYMQTIYNMQTIYYLCYLFGEQGCIQYIYAYNIYMNTIYMWIQYIYEQAYNIYEQGCIQYISCIACVTYSGNSAAYHMHMQVHTSSYMKWSFKS